MDFDFGVWILDLDWTSTGLSLDNSSKVEVICSLTINMTRMKLYRTFPFLEMFKDSNKNLRQNCYLDTSKLLDGQSPSPLHPSHLGLLFIGGIHSKEPGDFSAEVAETIVYLKSLKIENLLKGH